MKKLKQPTILIIVIAALLGIQYGIAYIWHFLGVVCGEKWGTIIFWVLCIIGLLLLQYRAVEKSNSYQDLIAKLENKMRCQEYRRATNNIHGWFIDENNTRDGVRFTDYFCRAYYLTYKNRRPNKKELKQLLAQLKEEELSQNN